MNGEGFRKTRDVIPVHFKSIKDFRSRIVPLWQDQKENETYEFTFENEEVEEAFNDLMSRFEQTCVYIE